MASEEGKPAVLIIGGLGESKPRAEKRGTQDNLVIFTHQKNQLNVFVGYIGRFLALHIHNNNLASQVRLVDKQLPELARLSPEFKEACSRDRFVQADASRERRFVPLAHSRKLC